MTLQSKPSPLRLQAIERWLRAKSYHNAPRMRDAAIAVIHLYRDRSEISSQDAAAALGCSLQYARRIIESLVRRGILTPTRNRRGRGVRYSVTDPHGAPQKFLRSKKKQQSDNQSNGLKRISEAAKSSCK
ncbi:MAG: hypothetical protein KatS3mg038_1214 [Candidatus Kapaibacterium sp.]|nr:MAG: hypothetical protein KatS3mg038_1214 [Candidatus Kapabacteria bacterium]